MNDRVGTRTVYTCDGCGAKQQSGICPPPPALAAYPLPSGWKLGLLEKANGNSPLYCVACAPDYMTEMGQ